MTRAAHRDALVERGTTWRLAFQLWEASGDVVEASTLAGGDKVMLADGFVHTVYDVTTTPSGSVRLRFEAGSWTEPVMTVAPDALFQLAAQTIPIDALAAYEYETEDPDTGAPLVVRTEIPHVISGGSIILILDADATRALPDGAGVWDVTVQTPPAGDWVRALEGQFSAIPTVSGTPLAVPA